MEPSIQKKEEEKKKKQNFFDKFLVSAHLGIEWRLRRIHKVVRFIVILTPSLKHEELLSFGNKLRIKFEVMKQVMFNSRTHVESCYGI